MLNSNLLWCEGNVEILKRSKLTTVEHYALGRSGSERHLNVGICEIHSSCNQEIRIWYWFHNSLKYLSAGMQHSASALETLAILDRLGYGWRVQAYRANSKLMQRIKPSGDVRMHARQGCQMQCSSKLEETSLMLNENEGSEPTAIVTSSL
jgi:hypothetical protein